MKKFVSLILAALLILSCVAFADFENTQVLDTTDFVDEGTGIASQSTDAWLQVTADGGTIDCTVPLVLVFQTNIDGGSDTTSEEYVISNNSTAALKVTEVAITDVQQEITANGIDENPMTLVAADSVEGYNTYSLTVLPDDQYDTPIWDEAEDVTEWDQTGNVYAKTADEEAEAPGLWRIEKASEEGEASESYVAITMTTSKLSFITKKANDDADPAVPQMGVKVFNVAYTVKIDDSTAVGDVIMDETENHEYGSYDENWDEASDVTP